MAFGYDRPLQEYFMQVFNKKDDLIIDINSSGMSMVPGPRRPRSNSYIYEQIKGFMSDRDWKKNEKMLENLLLDLPF